ncbi:MAG: ATP-dependent dethiobiotin synthetase BioD [Bacteroidia bacterium]|jgi:dethiobiotin synthetase|nr:MAG: ATP-dependent dethiobiotin synthetase BioD [Bacteroidia bacterium]
MQGLIVTGIHTDAGKTVVAAALTAGLGWTYWKPVQTGTPTDSERLQAYGLPTLPERYRLQLPAAPLVAAQAENISIDWTYLSSPPPQSHIIIEGAGGLFVPITSKYFMIDLFAAWKLPLVLVVRPYLGAMNHTWLSIEAIQRRGLPFLGIILCGTTGDVSETYFRETFSPLGEIPWDPQAHPIALYQESGLAETLPPLLGLR